MEGRGRGGEERGIECSIPGGEGWRGGVGRGGEGRGGGREVLSVVYLEGRGGG